MRANSEKVAGNRRHRLFVRIFLHGLLLIFVVSAAATAVFALHGNTKVWHSLPTRLAEELARDIEPGSVRQEKLKDSLEKLHRILHAHMAVYTYEGVELAHAGPDPPSPVEESKARAIKRKKILRHWGGTMIFLPIPARTNITPCYVVIDWPFGGDPRRLVLGILTIVLLVGLMSIPVARALTRPLEKLTSTARRLAKGELNARTGILRRDEVGILANTIDEMAELLQRRIANEKELLANVSHEIRTPLARIKVALELSDDGDADIVELREHLVGIANDVDELNVLIEDVLTVARLDLKGTIDDDALVTLRRGWVNPKVVYQACLKRFQNVHPLREINSQCDEFSEEVFIDEKLFRRGIDNLLDNAVQYSEPSTSVEFIVSNQVSQVVFEVRDRGIGLEPEDIPNLFEPFYRSERSRSRRAGGSGLGLTICKRIAQAHEAQIDAWKREGDGTVFRIRLPKN